MKCQTCDADPCGNPSFCKACRDADGRRKAGVKALFDMPIRNYSASDLKQRELDNMSPIERALAEKDELRKWFGKGRVL